MGKHYTKKRSIALILVLVMVMSAVPLSMWTDKADAATAETRSLVFNVADGKMYVDDSGNGMKQEDETTVYTEQPDNWSWDSVDKILTLKGFTYETTGTQALSIHGEATVELANGTTNTLDGGAYGLYTFQYNLTITGEGTLNVNGGNSTALAGPGMNISGALTINGGNINAFGKSENTNFYAAGIYVKKGITINGGNVSASSSHTNIANSFGIYYNEPYNYPFAFHGGILTAYGQSNSISSYLYFNINKAVYQYWSGTDPDNITKTGYYTTVAGDGYDTAYSEAKYLKIDATIAEVPKTYQISVSPSSINFGNVAVGYNEQSYTSIEIKNTGTGDITSLSAIITNDDDSGFELGSPVNDVTIEPGETATIAVRPKTGLQPHTNILRTYTGTLSITANNGISNNVPLTVKILPQVFSYSLSPSSVTFPELAGGFSESDLTSRTVEITNTGSDTITGLTANAMNQFDIISQVSPSSIVSGATARITVKPKFYNSPGEHSEELTITGDDGFSCKIPLLFNVTTPTVNDIVAQINNLKHNGTGELTASANGNTITVNGEVTDAVDPEPLNLYVPDGCKIIWNAKYSAKQDETSQRDYYENPLIYFKATESDDYSGTFELTKNGLLSFETSHSGTLLQAAYSTVNIMGEVSINGTSQPGGDSENTSAIWLSKSIGKVTDGMVSAIGNSCAFNTQSSYLLYLKNTVAGYIHHTYNEDTVIEVDSLSHISTRHGTSDGLRIIDNPNNPDSWINSAKWDMSGNIPVVEIVQHGGAGWLIAYYKQVRWGTKVTASLAGATVSKISEKTWSGSQIKPVPAVKVGGQTLKNGTDYTVSYKNNKNIGIATAVITGKGLYQGTKTVTFKIIPKKVALKKLTAGKKKVTVTWKKSSSAQKIAKYQIQYRIKGKKSWSKIKNFSSKSFKTTFKKLKKGKKYQFRIRSYKTVNKVKYYSDWSSVKTSKKIK